MNTSITSLFRISKDVPDGEIWFVCDQGFYKEDKMDEIIIDETNERISALVSYLKTFADSLEKLRPKPIEKEVELKDGQIYKNQGTDSSYCNCYYLLIKHQARENEWKLVSLRTTHQTWSGWRTENSIKYDIKNEPFTLCPNAQITVLTFDKGI